MSLNYRFPRPPSFLSRLFFTSKATRPARSSPFFRPSAESLEPRTVFSGLVGEIPTSVVLGTSTNNTIPTTSLEASALPGTSDPLQDIADDLVASGVGLAGSSMVATETPAAPAAGSTTGGGPQSFLLLGGTAPRIVDFTCSVQAGWLTFQGRVVDDQDPTGLTVYFMGMFGTHMSTVDADDWFEWQISYNPYMHGTVSCMTVDTDFNMSNVASVYV